MMINTKKKYLTTRRITIIGVMTALIIALNLANVGIINLNFIGLPISVTILHIPVIIGAILEGPLVGAILGLFFGMSSLLSAIYRPDALGIWIMFLNPLVSIIPRILIGITTYYTYRFIKIKNETIRVGAAAAIGTMTNTIGVLLAIYLIYAQQFLKAIGMVESNAAIAIGGVALTNGVPELIFSVIICIPIILIKSPYKAKK